MKSRIKSTIFILCICTALVLSNVSAAVAAPLLVASNQSDADTAIADGFDYIATQMNDDGGIRWTDESSNVSTTVRVVMALASANYPQDYLTSDSGNSPIDYLLEAGSDWVYQSDAEEPALSIARAGQLLTAVAAANEDPHDVGTDSLDLVYVINENYDSTTGVFGEATTDNVLDQVWAILGLAASTQSVPAEAVDWLSGAQAEDGSWNDGWGSYIDTTPIAFMALIASGHSSINSAEVQAGVAFMQTNQDFDGGWLSEWDTVTNVDTTGIMLQGISALDELPYEGQWQQEGGNPYYAVLNLQQEDGSIGGDSVNAYSTADAILGLSGQPLYNLSYLQGVTNAFEYVFDAQENDGGWGDVGGTIDVILALRSAGWDPETVKQGDASPLTYVEDNLTSYLESGPDAIGKAILGVVAAGEDPTDFAGTDLVSTLMATYDEETGAFGTADNTWYQALAILGLYAASADIPEGAVDTLIGLQQDDGGWEYSAGYGSWPDNTALAVQALLAAGISSDDTVVQSALDYIQSQQVDDGDWGDSSTTAYVLTALNALGISSDDWKTTSGKTPLPTLFSYQKTNGSFVYSWESADDNMLSTTAALLAALSGDFLVSQPGSGDTNYAGLVIDPGEGDITTACVAFEEDSLTGFELLEASGIEYDAEDGFLNSIMGVVNPDGGTQYWSYWYFDGREWNFYSTGASESVIEPGSIDGWHFTSWETYPSLPSDVILSLSEICGVEVLKDYTVQPYLSFDDLNNEFTDTAVPDEADLEATEEAASTEEVAEEEPTAEPEEEQAADLETEEVVSDEESSDIAIYLIIVAGVIVGVVIYFFVFKKKA